MIRAVVFDVDNTLVDFIKWKYAAVDAAIPAMIDAGLDLSFEQARRKIFDIYDRKGIEYQEVFDDLLQEVLGYIDYRILAAGIVAYRRAREGSLVAYPHVRLALLKLFRMHLKLAVVSQARKLHAGRGRVQLGVDSFFDVVVAFEDTGRRKPAPEPFQKALELLDVRPDEAMMVGDWAERDILGAKEIGMTTVFARYGDTFGTKNSGADFEIDDIIQLIPIVEALNSKGSSK
ncbi:MAG: HAD-IA family hydrolase [candidate division WOR-3 bacterium]